MFECPGCKGSHKVNVGSPNSLGARWSYNGDPNKPTFSPSLLIRGGHYLEPGKRCWCDYNREQEAKGEKPAPFGCFVCHSFVVDGKIQFLSDCTHELAGQTVELPEL